MRTEGQITRAHPVGSLAGGGMPSVECADPHLTMILVFTAGGELDNCRRSVEALDQVESCAVVVARQVRNMNEHSLAPEEEAECQWFDDYLKCG